MTGTEAYAVRQALAKFLGRPVSQRDLCEALGLSVANNIVRDWEKNGCNGPGAVALKLMTVAIMECGATAEFVREMFEGEQKRDGT